MCPNQLLSSSRHQARLRPGQIGDWWHRGYIWNDVLLYETAGIAWADYESNTAVTFGTFPVLPVYNGAARSHREIESHDATVLSTGTWFIAMRSPMQTDAARFTTLAERRDCLVNVDVAGAPVPSSRFMGGREIEMLIGPGVESVSPPSSGH